MKPRFLLLLLLVAALAGGGGWWFARRSAVAAGPAAGGRTVLFYQSAMHPWIKSDRPGKCTICGMDLTPVYEGQSSLDSPAGLVTLPESSVTVLGVTTTPVRRGTLRRTLRVAGTIKEDDTRRRVVAAYVAGRIERLFVNYVGAEVAASAPLLEMYSPLLLQAEREYVSLTRQGTAADLLTAARLRLRRFGLSETQIAALPDKAAEEDTTLLLAPASGTVISRFAYEGQYVMEGERLFELADFSRMWFQFEAYEQDLPWLHVGQEVEVTAPSVPGRVLRAPIRFLDPNLTEATRSARVRVELDNPVVETAGTPRRLLAHRAWAEGRVRVELPATLLVPRSAVLNAGGDPVAYVEAAPGSYEQRPLLLGRVGDSEFEVLAGLAEGERVVLRGNLLIDAQARLNQALQDSGSATLMPSLPPLNDPARLALLEVLTAADAPRRALATDDLVAFHAALPAARAALTGLPEALPEAAWQPLVADLASLLPREVADLRAARAAWHPFSERLADLALAARRAGAAPAAWKVYECPMTSRAFDGAPPRARWFQTGAPIRNPWYGAAMLDCGTEVRP